MRVGVVVLLLLACGPPVPATPPVGPVGPSASPFAVDEDRVLHILAAADLRVAQRGIQVNEKELRTTAMAAILNEDKNVQIEGGQADPFSFEVRGRAIDEASKIVAKYDPKSGLEVERLARLVQEEKERLARERDLPLGAITLFPGLAATWEATVVPAEAERMDAHLAKRFDQVAQAMSGSLSPEERDALEKSLDPIEGKITPAYAQSQAALVRLRVKLAQASVVVKTSAPLPVDASVEPRLVELEKRLRQLRAERAVAEPKSANVSFRVPRCRMTGSGASKLGQLFAPSERLTVCAIVTTFAPVAPAELRSPTLEAFHDEVVVGLWALAIAGGEAPAVAIGRQRPLEPPPPDVEAEMTRRAALRPTESVATALAIEWLMKDGTGGLIKRAAAWDTFGDAPVDIAIREIKLP